MRACDGREMFAGLARRVPLPACVYAWARSTRTCCRVAYTTTTSANIYPQSEASHLAFAADRVALEDRNRNRMTASCIPSSRNRRHPGIVGSTETAATLSPRGPGAAHCGACAKRRVATTSWLRCTDTPSGSRFGVRTTHRLKLRLLYKAYVRTWVGHCWIQCCNLN